MFFAKKSGSRKKNRKNVSYSLFLIKFAIHKTQIKT